MNQKNFTATSNCLAPVLKDEWVSVGRTHQAAFASPVNTWMSHCRDSRAEQSDRKKQVRAQLCFALLSTFFYVTVKQRESSQKESAFHFIKQTSEWPFADQKFQPSSPAQLPSLLVSSLHSMQVLHTRKHPAAGAAVAPHHPLVDLKVPTSLKEIYIQVVGHIPMDQVMNCYFIVAVQW